VQSAALRIGTRVSPLALAQAAEVRRAVATAQAIDPEDIAIVPIRTSGDRITDRSLAEAGGKGLFTKEIDEALLAGRIDIAVHSAKDMPTQLPDGIAIAACLPRADPRDAFVSPVAARLGELPDAAVVGTSSLRRKAMALRARPDLTFVALRGNVETRLRKLDAGDVHAVILAAAGLARLGLAHRASGLIETQHWLPAVGQGVIAVAARADDAHARDVLARVDHRETTVALAAERAFLAVLDGSCRTPIGGLALVADKRIAFSGIIVKPDGSAAHEVRRNGPVSAAERIGADAGVELADRGGADFFAVG